MNTEATYLRSRILEMACCLPGLQVEAHNDLLRADGDVERLQLIFDRLHSALDGLRAPGRPEA